MYFQKNIIDSQDNEVSNSVWKIDNVVLDLKNDQGTLTFNGYKSLANYKKGKPALGTKTYPMGFSAIMIPSPFGVQIETIDFNNFIKDVKKVGIESASYSNAAECKDIISIDSSGSYISSSFFDIISFNTGSS